MRRLTAPILVAMSCSLPFLFPASVLAGTLVTVPLSLGAPELEITPVAGFEQTFTDAGPWLLIESVRLRLVGRHTCQYASCAENPGHQAAPTDAAVAFGFRMEGADTYRTVLPLGCVSEGEAFDVTLDFAAGETPDWTFLAAGTGTVFVDHEPTAFSCSMFPIFVGVDAVITKAELLVELSDGVSAEARTWSAVKATYR